MLRKVLPILFLVVATAMAHAEKVSGFVKGTPSGKTFMLGSNKGQFTVDASKATVRNDGKFFSIAKLTGGSQVTVEGTVKGKTIMATTVNVGHLAGSKPAMAPTAKPGVMPGKKPMGVPGKKPMTMPAAKPGAKPAAKPGAKPAAKPGAKPAAKPGSKPAGTPKTDPKSSKTKPKK